MEAAQRPGSAGTRDGASLQYVIHGDDRSEARRIVLIHSLGMSGAAWTDVIRQLPADCVALTYDCRGHGASTRSAGPYRLESFADDLADLLDAVRWDAACVAGASMGGSIALQFAARYPQRVRALGLFDTTAWYGEDAAARWDQRAAEAEQKGLPAILDFQEARWFSDRFRTGAGEAAGCCRAIFLANSAEAFGASCRMLGAFDLRASLPGIGVPTAIVVGEEDYATPVAMARALQDGIAGATLQILPGVRHLTFVECPAAVAAALGRLMSAATDANAGSATMSAAAATPAPAPTAARTGVDAGNQRVRAHGDVTVDVGRLRVFEFVREAEKIARCIPGCRDLAQTRPGRYSATLTGKVGFMALSFKVDIEVVREEAPSTLEARIVGDAVGKHGHLVANASLQLEDAGERQTTIRYATDVGLTGKLGGLGQPAFNSASVKLAQEFGANLKAEIESAFWAERFK